MMLQEKYYLQDLVAEFKEIQKQETLIGYQNLINTLRKVRRLQNEVWLLSYYKSICYIRMGFLVESNQQKDRYFDSGERYLKEAFRKKPNESELYVLRAMMRQGRILVSVIARGMIYISLIEEDLKTAIKLNPNNPRAYFLLGQSFLNKPSMLGGNRRKALHYFKLAKEKFEKENNEEGILPSWGELKNLEALEGASKNS